MNSGGGCSRDWIIADGHHIENIVALVHVKRFKSEEVGNKDRKHSYFLAQMVSLRQEVHAQGQSSRQERVRSFGAGRENACDGRG